MKNNPTCIVILNYQNALKTIACLKSLVSLKGGFDIHLIDNASKDGSSELLYSMTTKMTTQLNSKILFHSNSDNFGFAGGQNPHITNLLEKQYQYFWLLNNDTIVEPNTLVHILNKFSQDEDLGIVGSKLLYPNGNIQTLGGAQISSFFGTTQYIKEEHDLNKLAYINGASFCVKREVIEKVGVLPDAYFLYFEEVDYCYQVKKAGYNIGVALDSIVIHDEGSTTHQGQPSNSLLDTLMISNRYLFHKRHLGSIIGRLLALVISILIRIKRLQFKRIIPIIRASFSESFRLNVITQLKNQGIAKN